MPSEEQIVNHSETQQTQTNIEDGKRDSYHASFLNNNKNDQTNNSIQLKNSFELSFKKLNDRSELQQFCG